MTSRRGFLTIVGGGVVLAATGGALWAATRDPARARRPWEMAGAAGEGDPRRVALSYAILAPNPHNRQPWLVDLSTEGQILLLCDPERRLPQTDPFDRQITIGLGCFLEVLAQAAAQQGFLADIDLFLLGEPQPRLDARPVARITLTEDGNVARDPLFAQVLARRSNKDPYSLERPVDTDTLATLASAARGGGVHMSNDPAKVAGLRRLAWDAMHTEITTHDAAKESIDLMRIGKAEIEANPDGIDLSGAFLEGLHTLGLLPREEMLNPDSSIFRQQLPILKAPFDTAMAFIWQTTSGNSRAEQIAAGRDHVRLNLAATALGVSMQPMSQALQEFDAMRPHHHAMREALGVADGETLQMLSRLGYGPTPRASPRWPYETRIRDA